MPATEPQTEKLLHLHTLPALVSYLVDELHWPITVDAWEDAFFEWTPEELNLKPEHEVAIRGIKQLRPLASNQPWGIFFVDFDKRQLPIVVLRRVLNGLAIKRRTTGGGHQTWHARDLLFISSFGEGTADRPREIALAHFSDESEVGDLPTLRVLGWDAADTPLELRHVAATLKSKLIWPQATQTQADLDAWRAQWAGAFRLQKNQVINDSKSLALALAELAKNIRNRVTAVLGLESERGQLRLLHKAFRDNLIADLTEDGFADMYAQTITYGLFAARASRGSGALVADDAALMVPSTNPFLRDLLRDFLTAGGRAHRRDRRVDFDELGINEVVQTLRDVPMDAVLRAFNNYKPGDDPVIHFYEDFLKAYDKKLRAKRGVFYTPRPVVQFIVRSIDEILKSEFQIADGLASTITWGEYLAQHNAARLATLVGSDHARPPLTLPAHCTADTPFVQILDPATGTATFLVEIIDLIHGHMKAKWRKDGCLTEDDFKPRWNEYVRDHLLPRLCGFELMMAPYAIAHMKIGLKLAETGYTFPEDGPRVKVFLTNALEPAHPLQAQLEAIAPMLAHEAASANAVKEQLHATVIVGNPPYSKASQNLGDQYQSLVEPFRLYLAHRIREPGAILFERDINNDYVKFLGFGRNALERSVVGILGFITSSSYLDGKNFRGVRDALTRSFTAISVVNLHGDSRSGSLARQGVVDENVFDIETGVCTLLATRSGSEIPCTKLSYRETMGLYDQKVAFLATDKANAGDGESLIDPKRYKSFTVSESTVLDEYSQLNQIDQLYLLSVDGIKTSRDGLVIANSRAECASKVQAFMRFTGEPAELEREFGISVANWNFKAAQAHLRQTFSERRIRRLAYRPLDFRYIYYDSELVFSHRESKMSHLVRGENVALVCASRLSATGFNHVLPADCLVEMKYASHDTNSRVFPVFLYADSLQDLVAEPNASGTARKFLSDTRKSVEWVELNHAVLAILNSPAYRARYLGEIKNDFPRVPIFSNADMRNDLAALGQRLIRVQLMKSEVPDTAFRFVGTAGANIATPILKNNDLHISDSGYFSGVSSEIFEFQLAGYQVCKNWVSAGTKSKIQRKGRPLTQADLQSYRRLLFAIQETIKVRLIVDEVVEKYGGWPKDGVGGTFSLNSSWPEVTNVDATPATPDQHLVLSKETEGAARKISPQIALFAVNGLPSTMSLSGADAELDDLAAATGETSESGSASASGATPRQKRDATQARAAGGATSSSATANVSALHIEDVTDWDMMCAIRAVLSREGVLLRDALIRDVAHELGFARTGTNIASALDDGIRRAVRRGIANNAAGELSLLSKTIEGYDRAFLKQHLLSCIGSSWTPKDDVPISFARMLGFARTGAVIEETVWNLMRSLIRSDEVESDGRGDETRYRKSKK